MPIWCNTVCKNKELNENNTRYYLTKSKNIFLISTLTVEINETIDCKL